MEEKMLMIVQDSREVEINNTLIWLNYT